MLLASEYPAGVTAVSTIARGAGSRGALPAEAAMRPAAPCSPGRSRLPACSPRSDCVQPTPARPRPRRPAEPERQP